MSDRSDHQGAGGHEAPVIVVMGVTGSGKTTVGRLLARRLGLPFYDADDFHSVSSLEKLAADIPLDDADREPWLNELASKIRVWSATSGAVLACSSLKHSYRNRFRRAKDDVRFVFLHGDPKLIAQRLEKRAREENHIIKDFEDILIGQYRDLEMPTDALKVDINQAPAEIVDDITRALSLGERLRDH